MIINESALEKYHIAQINIAQMKGTDINDPVMLDFVSQLDEINSLADQSNGFIWRLQSGAGNAVSINPFNDNRVLVNFSVWRTVEDLEYFVYHSLHKNLLRDRRKWFEKMENAYYALWYTPAGKIP